MHHNAATAMAQRADMLRGLSPRESSLALNYATGPRGGWGGHLLASAWADPSLPESALVLDFPGPLDGAKDTGVLPEVVECGALRGLGGVSALSAQTWQVVESGVCLVAACILDAHTGGVHWSLHTLGVWGPWHFKKKKRIEIGDCLYFWFH